MSPGEFEQVGHVARMAVMAMCARGVAASEFESSPEVQAVVITVTRVDAGELPIDLEFLGAHSVPIGGMSL